MKEFTVYQDDSGEWVVISDKLPGFTARGKTRDEALEKIKAAMRMYYPCGPCKDR